jgi:predicted TIM-barrel fold metal-dependent hydrolase
LDWISPFLEALLQVALDRMMFSADHPHHSMTECTTFLAGLPLVNGHVVLPSDGQEISSLVAMNTPHGRTWDLPG